MKELRYINFAVTYRCNSRCVMCNIWKKKQKDLELSLKEIHEIFRNPILSKVKGILITGGEPFLREDIVDIINTTKQCIPKVKFTINTNGFLTDIIVERMRSLEFKNDIRMVVSIDGNEKIHNSIRRIPDAFNKALNTLSELKKMDFAEVGIGFTISKKNLIYLLNTKKYFENSGFTFSFNVANVADHYYENRESDFLLQKKQIPQLNEIIKELKKGKKISERAFLNLMREYIFNEMKGIKKPVYSCYSGTTSIFLDPYGNIYPCLPSIIPFGNIKKEPLDFILKSKKAILIKKKIKNKKCGGCFLGCELGSSLPYNKLLILRKGIK